MTIKKAGDGGVIFDGGYTFSTGIAIWGSSYITIQGIELQRFTANSSGAFLYGASGVNVGTTPTAASSHIVLEDLYIHDSSTARPTGTYSEIAMWCSNCELNAILSSRIESIMPTGVALGSPSTDPVEQGGLFQGNTVRHVRNNHLWQGVVGFHANGWTIDGNYFDETSSPYDATDYLVVSNAHQWTIANNVFYQPPHAAIQILDDADGGNDVESHEVLNNTIECAVNLALGPPIGIRSERCSSCEIRNNIISACDSAVRIVDDNSNTNFGFNDLFDNATDYDVTELGFGHVLVGGDISADPLFTQDTPRPDPYYRLRPSSSAIDAGDPAHCGGTADKGGCDIGAFQFLDNVPAERPSITDVDGITGTTAVLHGSAFVDSDPGDTHQASQWQVDVLAGDFSQAVLDSGRTTSALTSFAAHDLEGTTTYKSRVRYQDQDDAWSPWSDSSLDTGDEFTTLIASAIVPMVLTVEPTAGQIGVVFYVAPVLTFNTPIDPASVTASTVKMARKTKPTMAVAAVVARDGGTGRTVTITPSAFLDFSSKYKIQVVGGRSGVSSRDGNIPGESFSSTFTTETALIGAIPADGGTGVQSSVTPRVFFKSNVSIASVTMSIIKLTDATSGRSVPLASIAFDPIGQESWVTLTPAMPLKGNHTFVITVKAGDNGLKFVDGRRMGEPVKIKFKTAPSP